MKRQNSGLSISNIIVWSKGYEERRPEIFINSMGGYLNNHFTDDAKAVYTFVLNEITDNYGFHKNIEIPQQISKEKFLKLCEEIYDRELEVSFDVEIF